ncbi:MAG: M3 family metallopeptidase, partial [Candidatus Thorarchaeota archaeon]
MTEEGIIRKMDWNIDPSTFQSTSEEVIEEAKKALDDIAKTSEENTSLETLLAFEEVLAIVKEELAHLIFLKSTSTNKAQRDAGHEVEQEYFKFINEVLNRNDIYNVLARLESQITSFEAEEQILLKKTLEDFRHRGAALMQDMRMEFLEIANNISVRQSDFSRALNETTDTVPCTKEELEGVPEEIFQDLEMEGDKYLLSLDYPIYYPVIQFAKNPKTRERMQLAFYRRGGEENVEKLIDTLALRDRQAKLLHHDNFAVYEISRKMAKTPERVFDFMYQLKEKLTPLSLKEADRMRQLKSDELGIPFEETELKVWDLFYYNEILKKQDYSIDQNEIKKYFPMESVVE